MRSYFEPVEQDIALACIAFHGEAHAALRTGKAEAQGLLLGRGAAEADATHVGAARKNGDSSGVAIIRGASDFY